MVNVDLTLPDNFPSALDVRQNTDKTLLHHGKDFSATGAAIALTFTSGKSLG